MSTVSSCKSVCRERKKKLDQPTNANSRLERHRRKLFHMHYSKCLTIFTFTVSPFAFVLFCGWTPRPTIVNCGTFVVNFTTVGKWEVTPFASCCLNTAVVSLWKWENNSFRYWKQTLAWKNALNVCVWFQKTYANEANIKRRAYH